MLIAAKTDTTVSFLVLSIDWKNSSHFIEWKKSNLKAIANLTIFMALQKSKRFPHWKIVKGYSPCV